MMMQWIDGPAIFATGLWVAGMSALVAIAGFRIFMRTSSRQMDMLAWLFGAMMCMGLALSLSSPLQKLIFATAGVVCAVMLIARLRNR